MHIKLRKTCSIALLFSHPQLSKLRPIIIGAFRQAGRNKLIPTHLTMVDGPGPVPPRTTGGLETAGSWDARYCKCKVPCGLPGAFRGSAVGRLAQSAVETPWEPMG